MKAGGANPTLVNGYDPVNRVVSRKVNAIDPATGAVTGSRTSYTCYDTAGNVAAVYQPLAGLTAPPASCPAAAAASAAAHTTLYGYDLAHRRTTTIEPLAITRCRFACTLADVVFDGRRLTDRPDPVQMEDADFTGAVFDQVEFMGFRLERVILPRDPDRRLIRRYRCVIERGLASLDDDSSLEARMLRGEFANRLKMMKGTGEESDVFNRRDYLASGGQQLAALAERVLGAAEASCGTGSPGLHRRLHARSISSPNAWSGLSGQDIRASARRRPPPRR